MPARSHARTPLALERWNRWVAAHPTGNLLQTSQWGSLARLRLGMGPRHAGEDAGTPVAGAIVSVPRTAAPHRDHRLRPARPGRRLGQYSPGPGAPRPAPQSRPQAQGMGLLAGTEVIDNSPAATQLPGLGYAPSPRTIQPRSTIVVDLSPSKRHPGPMKSRPATTSGSRSTERLTVREAASPTSTLSMP